MDYEKKYNEALAIAKETYETQPVYRAWLEKMFPELRESEDERMMREFNDWLCEEIECRTNDLHDEKDRRTLNMLCCILTKVKERLEKQKEHFRDDTKMVEKQDYSGLNDLERAIHRGFLVAGVENVSVTIIKETAKECLEQVKPAEWSDEDENKLYQVMEVLLADKTIALQDNPHRKALHRAYDELLDWLKSLRPQSVQDKFNETMHVADKFEEGYKAGVYDTKAKSWKPSEEQMDALKDIAYGTYQNGDGPALRELYEQLKKLI